MGLGRHIRSMLLGDGAARAAFELGCALQARGAIDEAAAAYRRLGPVLTDFLTQIGPAGEPIGGPHFLVIGPGRSGTTWFKRRLAAHPQVMMLPGEPHYFSLNAKDESPDAYVRRFAGVDAFKRPDGAPPPPDPQLRIYGEKSPSYLAMNEQGLDLCAALFPHVRLICTVRDPVQRAQSQLKRLKPKVLQRILNRFGKGLPCAELDRVIAQGRYAQNLARWAGRFAPEQILLIDFRRLAAEPAAVYAETLAHIGAKPIAEVPNLERVGVPTSQMELPRELVAALEAAYACDRYDLDWLRAMMARAAAGNSGDTAADAKRATRKLGSCGEPPPAAAPT